MQRPTYSISPGKQLLRDREETMPAVLNSRFFLSFFVASRFGRVPLSSGMKLWLDELGSEGLEFC